MERDTWDIVSYGFFPGRLNMTTGRPDATCESRWMEDLFTGTQVPWVELLSEVTARTSAAVGCAREGS